VSIVVVDKAEITKIHHAIHNPSCVLSNTHTEGFIVIHDDLLEFGDVKHLIDFIGLPVSFEKIGVQHSLV
jgi:hypothetical protein